MTKKSKIFWSAGVIGVFILVGIGIFQVNKVTQISKTIPNNAYTLCEKKLIQLSKDILDNTVDIQLCINQQLTDKQSLSKFITYVEDLKVRQNKVALSNIIIMCFNNSKYDKEIYDFSKCLNCIQNSVLTTSFML